MHILVVDDEPAIREVLCEALRISGHQTAACESADVAVALLPYVEAVICDGLECDHFAVAACAHRLGKPIVLYTGSEEIAHAAAVAAIACVRKPGSVSDLLADLHLQAVEE